MKYDSDYNNLFLFYRAGLLSTEHALNDVGFQKLIAARNLTFDVIVLEQFYHDALLVLSHKFDAPVVTIATLGHAEYMDHAMGLVTPWSHVPHSVLTLDDNLSFYHRCYNFGLSLLDTILRRYHFMRPMQRMADKYFGNALDGR